MQEGSIANLINAAKFDNWNVIPKELWCISPAYFTKDSLIIGSNQVIQTWETPYMKKLAEVACSSGGNILEVGFGMGISASFIQQHAKVKKHVIIEPHPSVIMHCKRMFKKELSTGKMQLLKGFWEDVTPLLKDESFNGILFDTYPLTNEWKNHFAFFDEAYRLLKKNGILTYYSDEVDSFSEEHLERLTGAGFRNVDSKICKTNVSNDCTYWDADSILVPMINT